jgi:hypothetical protein
LWHTDSPSEKDLLIDNASLTEVVRQEVRSYAGEMLAGGDKHSRLYYVENLDDEVFSLIAPTIPSARRVIWS